MIRPQSALKAHPVRNPRTEMSRTLPQESVSTEAMPKRKNRWKVRPATLLPVQILRFGGDIDYLAGAAGVASDPLWAIESTHSRTAS